MGVSREHRTCLALFLLHLGGKAKVLNGFSNC